MAMKSKREPLTISRMYVLAAILITLCTGSLHAKSYEAARYDVTLHLDSQGVLSVTETAVFHFIAGPFTFVYRDISASSTDGIDSVQAWINGRPCPLGKGPGEVEIHGSSPVVVRWHFPPILDGNGTFTVQYRAAGTVRREESGQGLRWHALPPKRDYPIGSSEVVLEYPEDITPQSVELWSGGPEFVVTRGRAVAHLVNPPMRSDIIVDARFAPGSFGGPAPAWPVAQLRKEAAKQQGASFGGLAGIVVLVLGAVWLVRIRRPAFPGPVIPAGISGFSPPGPLAPALAGSLISAGGLRLGVLLDLGRRGVLRIEEVRGRFLGARHFDVVLCPGNPALAPHERALLESVFPAGQRTVRLQRFLTGLSGQMPARIREELLAAGLTDASRLRTRSRILLVGGLGFASAVALILIGLAVFAGGKLWLAGAAMMTFGAGLVLFALFALVLGATQSVCTESGVVEAARWKSYASHIRQAARGREILPGPGDMEQLLPYAAVFGVMTPLLKRQAREGGLALPPWFQAIQYAGGSDGGSFIAFTSACDTSTSSGDGGGGGGGASGGGSSGAG